jgi:hypothetical protein
MTKIPGKTNKTVTEESKAQNRPLGYHLDVHSPRGQIDKLCREGYFLLPFNE